MYAIGFAVVVVGLAACGTLLALCGHPWFGLLAFLAAGSIRLEYVGRSKP